MSVRTRFSGPVAAAALLVLATPAGAQTLEQTRDTMRLMQRQLDVLQAARNAQIGDPRMATALDAVSATPGPYVLAIGWAFRCGTTSLRTAMGARPARLDVLVDGLPIHAYFVTGVREDVRAAFVSYCGPEGVPADPGVYVFVDMSAYPLGRHYLSLRLSDDVSGAVVYSDTRPVDR